ncbi:flagellar export protein FliJ [Ornithinibacillus sp. 179-J 7C1 HS]|uniref:flagellar export protein FliJ n=1 Tax=Ornithinibacillus sp. 179-J 7C1 HS TaxID=3142384 RepID=UPI0039A13D82
MAGTQVLTKILDIREKEKKDAQLAYRRSVDIFEDIGTKLFNLLQKKEKAEEAYEEALSSNMHIEFIQDQLAYMERLKREIEELQVQVQQARANMESKQWILSEAHIETKKFEKIIEFRTNETVNQQKQREESFMNEISIQQYLSHKNR